MNGLDQWKTLPLNNKFNQYQRNTMIYHMLLTDSEKNQDEIFYRVHYYNETSHCWMNAGKLTLQDTGNCGLVYLRSEKLIKNGTVEIEYYPSKYVMENSGSFKRSWIHTDDKKSETLILANGSYEETTGQNNNYVLTIYMFSVSMNGRYSVYCGPNLLYTNAILLKLPEPPRTPVIVGLQDIERCRYCIVAEDNDNFELACEIHGGTRPLTITMTIGNESYVPLEWNSTTCMVLFTVRDNHHMANVIFSVMNDALSSPLSVTAQMFVIKPPTIQLSVPEILRVGEAVNITCTLDDGRPNPIVYFSIFGSEVSSANSHFYNSTTSLNTNVITLTTFKKEWNKENITCCRYNEWYTIVRACSPPKQVNYHFPPTDVILEVKVNEDNQMYATCTVYGSNPVCNVQFKTTSGIIGSEKSSENISLLPYGAWNSVYGVNLNVSEEDNGTDVTCIVECDEFPVDLTDTVKILLPYPPVIEFNISGSTLTISAGERAHVNCVAASVPASNISWIEELSNGNITMKQCDMSPNCVLNIDTDEVSNRRLMCQVHYRTKVDHKYLTVHIIEKRDSQVDYHKHEDDIVFSKQNPEVRPLGNLSQNAHALENEAEVPVYSQPVKKNTTEDSHNTYAQVNKTGKSASSKTEKPQHAQDGQLLYADLAFDPNETPSKAAVTKRRDSPTEYADIDYVKTKTNKVIDETPTEPDNIYANQ
ncbi:uncharacterized protein LOC132733044 isoform X2 [Ruditapes philippinarum]|uniref:uncharacterized protein LOC132733044 isoform X2 n=1 Tax=Ruditapes philippinarum TaxID=129788 RepID=UPI00295BF5BA|nr:uncharacterized protein LOC132733044 isoform X2 [Ruditapes philippinarum]